MTGHPSDKCHYNKLGDIMNQTVDCSNKTELFIFFYIKLCQPFGGTCHLLNQADTSVTCRRTVGKCYLSKFPDPHSPGLFYFLNSAKKYADFANYKNVDLIINGLNKKCI